MWLLREQACAVVIDAVYAASWLMFKGCFMGPVRREGCNYDAEHEALIIVEDKMRPACVQELSRSGNIGFSGMAGRDAGSLWGCGSWGQNRQGLRA
jgi:hypothetical protein